MGAAIPIPEQRDRADARHRLAGWLAGRLPAGAQLTVSDLRGPTATGFSSETLIFDATWVVPGDEPHEETFVVRVAPTGHSVFMAPNLDVQFRVLSVLQDKTTIPVPKLFWYEEDPSLLGAPFFVMRAVAGRVPQDTPPYHQEGWLVDVNPAQRAAVWNGGIDVIADIHRLDWRGLGLGFLDTCAAGERPIDRTLTDTERFLAWAAPTPPPGALTALDWLRAHRPDDEPTVLCWGDARIGNVIFDDAFAPAAVLDWEMVSVGAPAQDVAWALVLDRHHSDGIGVPRLPGFPDRAETVARYEARSGLRLTNLGYYEILAALRFVIVMARLGTILRDWDVLPIDSDFSMDNTATRLLDRMLVETLQSAR